MSSPVDIEQACVSARRYSLVGYYLYLAPLAHARLRASRSITDPGTDAWPFLIKPGWPISRTSSADRLLALVLSNVGFPARRGAIPGCAGDCGARLHVGCAGRKAT